MRRGLVAALGTAVAVGVAGGVTVASLDRGTVQVQTVGVTAPEPTPTATPAGATTAPSTPAAVPSATTPAATPTSAAPAPTTRVVTVPAGTVTLKPGEVLDDPGSASVPPRVVRRDDLPGGGSPPGPLPGGKELQGTSPKPTSSGSPSPQ